MIEWKWNFNFPSEEIREVDSLIFDIKAEQEIGRMFIRRRREFARKEYKP